jgi:pentatricopeptide repeat protein
MSDVNSTRLYDFAIRSLTRIVPLRIGLSIIILLISDLCDAQYYQIASNMFLLGLNRISLPLAEMKLYRQHKYGNNNNYNSSNISSSSRRRNASRIMNTVNDIVEDISNNSIVCNITSSTVANMTINHNHNRDELKQYHEKRRIMIESARRNARILNKYFNSGRKILGLENFPQKSYRIAAHAYKYADIPELMLDCYRTAINDNKVDKQLKNLVVYNLAHSIDYWDTALEILNNLKEKPDLFMLTSGLIACDTGHDWEQSIYLLECIQNYNYSLTTIAITSAISACAKAGRADEAIELLNFMSKKDISRNIWTFNSVISACSKQGRWKDALQVFEQMKEALTYQINHSDDDNNVNDNSDYLNDENNNVDKITNNNINVINNVNSSVINDDDDDEGEGENNKNNDIINQVPYQPSQSILPSIKKKVASSAIFDEKTDITNDNFGNDDNKSKTNNNNKKKKSKLHNDVDNQNYEENIFKLTDIKTSNIITFNSLIEVLGEGKQEYLVDEIYQEALLQNIIYPYENIDKGWIDLHYHSIHMSRAALRKAFEYFLLSLEHHDFITSSTSKKASLTSSPSSLQSSLSPEQKFEVEMIKRFSQYTSSFTSLLTSSLSSSSSSSPSSSSRSRPSSSSLSLQKRATKNKQIYIESPPKDLIIIVGKGDKLSKSLQSILYSEYNPSIVSYVSKVNTGRLIIPSKNIENWLQLHKNI